VQIGGLIGVVTGSWDGEPFPNVVRNSFATGNVTGGEKVGGLIGEVGYLLLGENNPILVDNTYATGNVTGTRATNSLGGGMIGGLIGSSSHSNISNSHATGNVLVNADGATYYLGGLVGRQDGGSISDSYATGTVVGNGGLATGGLVGGNRLGNGTVSDSYYQDANTVAASETTPVRMETGGIVDNVRLNESESTRKERENTTTARGSQRSGSSLNQYIYQDDESGYSAYVKAVSVEDECEDGEEDCN
jgi:hypothetical protein